MVHRLETTLFLVYQWLDYSLLELKIPYTVSDKFVTVHTVTVCMAPTVCTTPRVCTTLTVCTTLKVCTTPTVCMDRHNSVHNTDSVHDTDCIHNTDSVRDTAQHHNTLNFSCYACFKAQYRTVSPSMNRNYPPEAYFKVDTNEVNPMSRPLSGILLLSGMHTHTHTLINHTPCK